jgi:hypothetical protein
MSGSTCHAKSRPEPDWAEWSKHSQHIGNLMFMDEIDSKRIGRVDDSLAAEYVLAAADQFSATCLINDSGIPIDNCLSTRNPACGPSPGEGWRFRLVRSNLFEDFGLQRLAMPSFLSAYSGYTHSK